MSYSFVIISAIIFIILFFLVRSTKRSDNEYYYKESKAEYIKVPIWIILLVIVSLFIPILNITIAIISVIWFTIYITIADNVKFVPKGKILKFLTKGV